MNQVVNCPNCRTALQGPICHQCGQKARTGRWTVRVLIRQFIQQLTDIEKGFLFTIKMMFVAPGVLVRNYWSGKTVNYYGPFKYLLIWTAVNLAVSFWLDIDDLLQQSLQPAALEQNLSAAEIEAADQQFDSWLNVLVLLLIPVFSFFTQKLFSKGKYNYAENVIMNAYMFGQQSMISTLTQFIFFLFPSLFVLYIGFNFSVSLLYNTYVFKQVFQENTWITLLKALLIGILGLIVFGVLIGAASMVAIYF